MIVDSMAWVIFLFHNMDSLNHKTIKTGPFLPPHTRAARVASYRRLIYCSMASRPPSDAQILLQNEALFEASIRFSM